MFGARRFAMLGQALKSEESSLRMSYAKSRLAEIEQRRRVFRAAEAGMTQRDIAKSAHLSQPTVHRMIQQAKALGVEETIEEIVLARFVGDIDTGQMMRRLRGYPHWVLRVIDPADGLLPEDSRSEMDFLAMDGFLSDDEADSVVDAHE
ncbi:MAG: helix-turn-helix domain-containing protein [Bifidobacteriaceae bacterium]|jgi:DNA-binding Lrp family transcriptional regulator|nr:helix-turn-helix domain-containing protein [Bifidobacteriaceae bacterium]